MDQHHGHIVTGDLRIVTNGKLRKLLTKGPKYREPKSLDFSKAKEHIMSGLKTCISEWSEKML